MTWKRHLGGYATVGLLQWLLEYGAMVGLSAWILPVPQANVIGRMLGWAGEQSPISADKGGNLADEAVYGKMDCIDHSTTTTRLLKLLDKQGLLRFHEVLEPVLRRRFLVFDHFSAQIREKTVAQDGAPVYVVDSWFFDNGRPAAVMPLAQWQAGDDPNDDE